MASANASPAERKAYLVKSAVGSGTAASAVSIHLALAVAKKDSNTGLQRKRINLNGNADNAASKESSRARLSMIFFNGSEQLKTRWIRLCATYPVKFLTPYWNCLRHCANASADSLSL